MIQASRNVGEVQHPGPLDTKSTGFHPENPPFFGTVGEKTGGTWQGQRGPEEFQRVGWGPGEGELIPQPFPGRIPGIPVGFN